MLCIAHWQSTGVGLSLFRSQLRPIALCVCARVCSLARTQAGKSGLPAGCAPGGPVTLCIACALAVWRQPPLLGCVLKSPSPARVPAHKKEAGIPHAMLCSQQRCPSLSVWLVVHQPQGPAAACDCAHCASAQCALASQRTPACFLRRGACPLTMIPVSETVCLSVARVFLSSFTWPIRVCRCC
jgi:hypothetical protein